MKPKWLEDMKAFPSEAYANIDLTGLAAFVLHFFHTQNVPTTFENIVIAVYKMFPEKFCLVGFQEYPDSARVGRTLLQLGPKYRNWARGSVQKGFVITERGLEKVQKVKDALESNREKKQKPFATEKKNASRARTMDISQELAAIESSQLFGKWKKGALVEAKLIDLVNLLGVYAYTPAKVLKDRLSALENIAIQQNHKTMADFIRSVKKHFSQDLSQN